MSKVLVLYDSKGGNTAVMAILVAEGAASVEGTEVRQRSIDEATVDDVIWCDGLALGSPTNLGHFSWKMKRFWEEQMTPHRLQVDGKIACAFSSAGAFGSGSELACQSLLTLLMNFGFLVFGATQHASGLAAPRYNGAGSGHAGEPDIQAACRTLGQRLASWTAVMIDGRSEQHPLAQSYARMPSE